MQQKMIQDLDLAQFAIEGDDSAWQDAVSSNKGVPGSVSVKSKPGKHKRSSSDLAGMRGSNERERNKKRS